jgi:MFS family permease
MYPGGRLSDALTRKTVLVSALCLTTTGLVMVVAGASYLAFLLGVAVFGAGGGLYWIALRALLADLFVARRGQAFGIQDSLGFIGPIVAAGGAVGILALTTWRMAFPGLIGVLLIVVVLLHRWVRGVYEFSRCSLKWLATGKRVFSDGHVVWLVVAYSGVVFAIQAMIGFLPTFLQAEKGFSPTLASVGFGVLFLGAVTTMPVAGYLGDRYTHTPVAIAGLTVSIGGLATLLIPDSAVLIGVGIFAFAAGVWAFPPVIQSHLMTRFPDDSMGGDFGAFKTVYAGLGSLGPAYLGFVAGVDTYATGFVGLVPLLLVSILIVLRVS